MKKRFIICLGFVWILLSTCVLAATTGSTTSSGAATNIVVDFDSTSFDSSLRAGDSGVMNLVVKNTGGYRAENVQISLPSTALVYLDKTFYAGMMDSGESRTFPVIVRVDSNARSGLSAIQVKITYNGFNSDGTVMNNKIVTWEIPFRIYGNPLFQITPSKTTYFKDNLDELELEGRSMDSVKDLEATLSSSCTMVIGSSRKYVGDINLNQTFKLIYPIKPSSSGACVTSLRLSYTDVSGNRAQDNISIGLNVEEAGVNFKVVNISYNPTGPGETTTVKISLKNVGNANADDTTLSLSLTSPFAPVDSNEKYIGVVEGGQTIDVEFNIAISWDATIQTYSIPLNITYKVGGTTYSVNKDIGVDVSGKIILQVISVSSSGSSVRIDVANIGTRTADGVKATLIIGGGNGLNASTGVRSPSVRGAEVQNNFSEGRLTGNRSGYGNFSVDGSSQYFVSYKSDIKPSKQTTFTFTTTAKGSAILTLEYTGQNNERITQTERITLSGGSSSSNIAGSARVSSGGGFTITTLVLYGLAIIIVTFVGYKLYKRRKNKLLENLQAQENK